MRVRFGETRFILLSAGRHHLRRLLLATLFAAGLAAPLRAAQELSFTLPQVREMAVQAALAGDTRTAAVLSRHLLRIDPNDPGALLAMSTVSLSFGDWDRAYRASRKAFRTSDNEVHRFHAARVAATSATAEKRLVPAQFWLRRAGDLAPTAVDRARIEKNFALLRAESPWRYRFSLSATPSSNVNGGSDDAYNVIDGLPFVGTLSPAAQALSGFVTQGSASVGYRFRRTARSRSEVNAALYIKRVTLSEESRAKAPGFDPAVLGATSLSVGVGHTMLVGQSGTVLRFEAGLRDQWVDSGRELTAVTGSALISRIFFDRLQLTAKVLGERKFYTDDTYGFSATALGVASYTFGDGGRLSAFVSYTENETPIFVFDNTSWVGKITYTFGKPVLGVQLAAGVGASYTDFPDYTFVVFPVPGGRQDKGVFFDLDARFTQVEYAGFSPSLRIRRAITDSNVSRFTTSEWAVSVGIESNF